MACPKCGGEQHCPCENCAERNEREVIWIWKNEDIECGHCGYTMNCNAWMDLEYEEYKKRAKENGE